MNKQYCVELSDIGMGGYDSLSRQIQDIINKGNRINIICKLKSDFGDKLIVVYEDDSKCTS